MKLNVLLLSVILSAFSQVVHADEGVRIYFNSEILLDQNLGATSRNVVTVFNTPNRPQQTGRDGQAYRGCMITVNTPPNTRRVIEKARILLLKPLAGEENADLASLHDPNTKEQVALVECFRNDYDDPRILDSIEIYLDATPVDNFKKVPVNYQSEQSSVENTTSI